MINKYTNKQRGLLAVIMAMVMVFAGAAFVAAEVDAADNIDAIDWNDQAVVVEAGTLTIDAKNASTYANGIECSGALTITITEGVTLDIDATGYGIYTSGDLTIDGEGSLDIKVECNEAMPTVSAHKASGIHCEGALTMSELASAVIKVDATETQANSDYAVGIYAKGNTNLSVNDLKVYAGNKAINVDPDGTVTISGNDVVLGGYERAIRAYNDVTFSDDAVVTLKLLPGDGVNHQGDDDRQYIKAEDNYDTKMDITTNGAKVIFAESENVNALAYCGNLIGTIQGNEADAPNWTFNDGTLTLNNYNGSQCFDGAIEIENVTVVTGTALMNAGVSFTIPTGITLDELVITAADGSKVEFNNITTSEEISISNGSVVIGGDIETIGGTIIVKSGTAKVNATTIGVPITVNEGATLIVPNNATVSGLVTNNGTIDLSGKLSNTNNINSGTIEVNDVSAVVKATNSGTIILNKQIGTDSAISDSNGTIALANGITVPVGVSGTNVVSAESVGNSFGMSKDLESDYTVKTNAFLANDLTIPEGVTLTVDGTLNLNGNDLNVLGNLVVSKKGIIEDYKTGGEIILTETGTVSNEGIIGNTTGVTVSAETGEVEMKGITGVEFSLTKVKDAGFFLTVSGEAAIKVKESNLLTINGAYIADGFTVKDVGINTPCDIDGIILKDATVTIGSKAVVDAEIEMQNGSTLIINGVIDGTVNMVNGAEVIINGESDATYTAKTGDFKTYGDDNKKQTAEQATTTDITTIVTGDLKGITISVTTRSYTAQDADKTPMTEQKLLVSGIAAVADGKDKNEKADLTVSGKAYVTEDSELVIPSEVIINTDNIIPEGLLKVIDPTADVVGENDVVGFTGAKYTITVTDEATYDETVTDYYTTFDAAYAAIADADEMTIMISGGYEFAKDYIIAAGQTVEAATGEFTITKDGTITIQDEGALDLPNLKVKGILTVIYGGDCSVPKTLLEYEVMSKNTETGDITYSGAELAIENAVAGDVIDIVNPVTFKDPVTIAEGVTVNVENGASITAEKGLTVAGKLVNEGTVEIADEYDLIVTGGIENEGTITLGTESEMTVTGTVVSDGEITTGTINAANYTDEDSIVYTTVASAVASGEDVAVSGKFTENADVVLAEEQTLTINGEVVLKSIRLVAGSTLTVGTDGILTADVIAAVGTEETTGALSDAVVDVTKINNISGWTVNYNEAKATYTMVMPAYKSGDAVIEAGSVNYTDANASFGAVSGSNPVVYKTMKVASGATLVVANNITDTEGDKKYFVNEGTIQVESDVTFENTLIGGQVVVSVEKDVEFKNSQITGTVTLSEKDGKVATATIIGKVLIGSTPETLGAAGSLVGKIYATAGYVIVFEGSTFQDITEDSEIESTAYSVNGIALATIYTADNSIKIANDGIKAIVNALEDVEDIGTENFWYAEKNKIENQLIGEFDSVDMKLGYEFVEITISAAPGIIVYIDDVVPTLVNGVGEFEIGTHAITIYLEKGYEGTPVVKLNGTEITDGKLVITTDMMDLEQNLLSVTGATVMQDQPVVIQPSDSEKDGMELTDILLIVLVVLIVIMAIIVALRMMRS